MINIEDNSPHKQAIIESSNNVAENRDSWIAKNKFFHEEDHSYMRFLVPEGLKVLELGCGTGELLSALKPAKGVGVDISEKMVEVAKSKFPEMKFIVGDAESNDIINSLDGPFDVIILSDMVGFLEDCQTALDNLHSICTPDTRIIISYYSHMWEPILHAAEMLGGKMPQVQQNWLSANDISSLLSLSDFDEIKREWRQLMPVSLLGIGAIVNRFIGTLPIIRKACLRNYIVARSIKSISLGDISATVLVPCRNEKGNIENAVKRLPKFCNNLELIYVEGHSSDGTYEECLRVKDAYPDVDIKVYQQPGKGKGDAVRKGFAEASGDVLMILDADLTVPPESMPKFYNAIKNGKGNFINGTRLVYPLEPGAMRFLNFWANRSFAVIFSFLLNQRFTDTLCGTKVLTKHHYDTIVANRDYFGDFDPFGDFDLIFGAAKLNLKIIEIPVRYADRNYGETQISRFSHGWLLARMVVFAYRKLKAF